MLLKLFSEIRRLFSNLFAWYLCCMTLLVLYMGTPLPWTAPFLCPHEFMTQKRIGVTELLFIPVHIRIPWYWSGGVLYLSQILSCPGTQSFSRFWSSPISHDPVSLCWVRLVKWFTEIFFLNFPTGVIGLVHYPDLFGGICGGASPHCFLSLYHLGSASDHGSSPSYLG